MSHVEGVGKRGCGDSDVECPKLERSHGSWEENDIFAKWDVDMGTGRIYCIAGEMDVSLGRAVASFSKTG